MTSLHLERCRMVIWMLAKLGFIVSSEGCECQRCSSLRLSLQLGSMLQLQPPLVYFIYGTHILKLFFFPPVVSKESLTFWFRLARIYFAVFWKWGKSCWWWWFGVCAPLPVCPWRHMKPVTLNSIELNFSFSLPWQCCCHEHIPWPAEGNKTFGMCEKHALGRSGKFQRAF